MSRNIIGKVNAEGELVAITPVSVGGLGAGEHIDLELTEDGADRHCIPGTSLGDPMRAWLERRLPEGSKLLDLLFAASVISLNFVGCVTDKQAVI